MIVLYTIFAVSSIIIMHFGFFSDLMNNSTVPMTDDNGSYVSVVGKYMQYSFAICYNVGKMTPQLRQ